MTDCKMRCYVCDGRSWHVLDKIHEHSQINVCKTCGNVAHNVDVSKEEELKKFYRYEYRPSPNHMNLLTTMHKRMYIGRFLQGFLEERDPKTTGKKMLCGDIGCATGYIPAWLRSIGHKATGSELTVTYRRFAEAFYNIPIPEELPKKYKYDFLSCYHVFEHLMDPDKKLAEWRDLLADDGYLFISTPEWFDTLEEASGSPVGSFENLFHKNHINVFSATSLKNIFTKIGFEIVKEDHIQYGQTYLLKKAAPATIKVVENWEAQVDSLEKIKKAILYHNSGRHELAIDTWKRFPEAWIALAHGKESKDPEKQLDIFQRALSILPDNMRLLMAYGTWLYMRENLSEALKVFHKVEQSKPNETLWVFMGYCYGKMGKYKEASRLFYDACEINPQKWTECMDYICGISVKQPTWDERALDILRTTLINDKIKSDGNPVFEDKNLDIE